MTYSVVSPRGRSLGMTYLSAAAAIAAARDLARNGFAGCRVIRQRGR